MKIFYAVQATGNGHISRAMELLPYLQQYGTVDIFLSGDNSHLLMDAPVKYRSKGLSLYFNSTGGLDYWKILRGFHPLSLRKEIYELPVEKYDLVINDFEYITSAACAKKRIPSVQLGHQASFQSKQTPRPATRNAIGEWVLKNYARATHNIGLHFECYDDFILPPVIKQEILDAEPVTKEHITVYLPSCSADFLGKILHPIRSLHFHVFSKEIKQTVRKSNITFFPVSKTLFNKSMIECTGIICGAGFETPAEALYLQKKMICIPTRGQYEQLCNAASLEQIGIRCLKKIGDGFTTTLYQLLEEKKTVTVNYGHTMPLILDRLWRVYEKMNSHVVSDYSAWPMGEFA
ncbi:MAG: glycosyl transferase [Chitinophagaceae bacterium]|nr:glycosyl transferase [Chitinophagaceae bacterium]